MCFSDPLFEIFFKYLNSKFFQNWVCIYIDKAQNFAKQKFWKSVISQLIFSFTLNTWTSLIFITIHSTFHISLAHWAKFYNFENRGGLYSHFVMKRRSINKYIAYAHAVHRDRSIQRNNFSDCIALFSRWWMKLRVSQWDNHRIICT